jgi:hypothetical protein
MLPHTILLKALNNMSMQIFVGRHLISPSLPAQKKDKLFLGVRVL